jgi:DNA-binding transcriptional MerR regulator
MTESREESGHAPERGQKSRRRGSPGPPIDLGSDKPYFKIGEVAEIVGVPPYVLRYWETEFRAVRPQKSRAQQRVYRRRDVETLLRIKHLLYEKKFTIAGARQELQESVEHCEVARPSGAYLAKQSLDQVRQRLEELSAVVCADDLTDATSADPAAFVRSHHQAGHADDAIEDGSLIAHGP